jgi:hypothetical protein
MFGKMRPIHNVNTGFSGQIMHQGPVIQQWNQQPIFRQQPFPYPSAPQNYSIQSQNHYYPQNYIPFAQGIQPGYVSQSAAHPNQHSSHKDSQFLFHNPLQPADEMIPKTYSPLNGYPMMNPYPKNNLLAKQPNGMQSFMNSFKSQDGSIDFNKMINTAGQMMNAVNQVSSLVKGVGGMFKA